MKDVRSTGDDRHDNHQKHQYWNPERNRNFQIDFEKGGPVFETEADYAKTSHSEELKPQVPKLESSQGSEPDWDGICMNARAHPHMGI